MKDMLVKYIRKNGKPIACLVAIKTSVGVYVGFSKYNQQKEDVAFSKETAKKLAISRAKNSHLHTIHQKYDRQYEADSYTPVPNYPQSMKKDMATFIERAMKFFGVDEIENAYVVKKQKNVSYAGDCVKIKFDHPSIDRVTISGEEIIPNLWFNSDR